MDLNYYALLTRAVAGKDAAARDQIYRDAYGRDPQSVDDLQRAGLLPGGYWGRAARAMVAQELSAQKTAAPSTP